jgi:hypothetical protein
MVYLKFQIVCMQGREELRALKSCQERENKEKGMSMEKKERKKQNMRMKE